MNRAVSDAAISCRDAYLERYRNTLLNDVLPFWQRHSVDREWGGFLTCLDRDGSVVDTDKGVWQQGRAAWLFGELYNQVEPRDEWLELAQHGVDFLDQFAFDPHDERMWFHLDQKGQPIRKRRYAFSESFAAIAYGELAKATGRDEYEDKARRCFQRFLDHNRQPLDPPKFTSVRPMRGIGFPMITINTAQELRESIQLETANEHIDGAIDVIRQLHVKEDIQCVLENVGPEGQIINHFDGRTLNPGHAIEGAWFVMAEGRFRHDESLVDTGRKMLDWMWRRGWDQQHGGLRYFVDLNEMPVQEYWHDMKFWWPHNEAMIATLMAAVFAETNPQHKSANARVESERSSTKFFDMHREVAEWSFEHFADRTHGEWFGYLHRDGSLSSPLKGNLWKGPFHLPRALLKCWRLLETLAETANAGRDEIP